MNYHTVCAIKVIYYTINDIKMLIMNVHAFYHQQDDLVSAYTYNQLSLDVQQAPIVWLLNNRWVVKHSLVVSVLVRWKFGL